MLAAGLGDWIDLGVIVGILALNAFVGFYQEKQAADVVASLKGDIAMKATVVRDGHEQQILARELVPGDIVCILLKTVPTLIPRSHPGNVGEMRLRNGASVYGANHNSGGSARGPDDSR